jgi:hypothetical protein
VHVIVQGQEQGPCSIANFRLWLARMRGDASMRREYEEFLGCTVWRRGTSAHRRMPLARLLSS